jgi:hypothetical protein
MAVRFNIKRPLFNIRFLNEEEQKRQALENRSLRDLSRIRELQIQEQENKLSFQKEQQAINSMDQLSEYQKTIANVAVQKKYDPIGWQKGKDERQREISRLVPYTRKIGAFDAIAGEISEYIEFGTNRSIKNIWRHVGNPNRPYRYGGGGRGITQAQQTNISSGYVNDTLRDIENDPSVPQNIKDSIDQFPLDQDTQAFVVDYDRKKRKGKFIQHYSNIVSPTKRGTTRIEEARQEGLEVSTSLSLLNAKEGTVKQRQDILTWVATPDGRDQQINLIEDAIDEVAPTDGSKYDVHGAFTGISEDRIREVWNDQQGMAELAKSDPQLANLIAQYMALLRGDTKTYADLVMSNIQGRRLDVINEAANAPRNLQGIKLNIPEDPMGIR